MATIAAEGPPDRRPFIHLCHDMFFSDQPDRAYGNYSYQLARQMNCGQTGHALKHNLRELRTALQLERRFTPDQLLNLYLDRAYFGPGIYGAESAATHYFGKHAGELLVPEAALLAGLITRPAYFSPGDHPDHALQRRNQVIEAMVQQGSISREEADPAKRRPLGVLPR
jgi:penicillin-binding protein 1A